MWADLAGVHGVREDRRANVHGRATVPIEAHGLAELFGRWQRGLGAEWDAESGWWGRRLMRLIRRRRLVVGCGELGRRLHCDRRSILVEGELAAVMCFWPHSRML